MTLSEIDALIDAAADPGGLILTPADWLALLGSGTRDLRLDDLGLAYRGLYLWIDAQTRVAGRREIAPLWIQ